MGLPIATNMDFAGGKLKNSIPNVYVTGQPVIVLGDEVTSHPPDGRHLSTPKMRDASKTVFVGGRGVVRLGDPATCGHSAEVAQKTVLAS